MDQGRKQRRQLGIALVVAALAIAVLPVAPALAVKPSPNPAPDPTPVATKTFKAAATAGGYFASGASIDIPVPSGVVAGDFLIAQVAYNANGTITPPAGWNLIDVTDHPTRPIMQGLFWRAATDSEPASYSFNLTSGKSDTVAGAIAAYIGIDLTNPIDAVGSQANGASTDIVAPSITTTTATTTLVSFFAVRDDGALTPPSGMYEEWDVNSAAGVGAIGETAAAGADETLTDAGATGTRVATPEASDGSIGHLVALQMAEEVFVDPIIGDTYVQWEDASTLAGVPQGQYGGSMEWITGKVTGASTFWKSGYTGAGIDIALIDSGVVPVDGLTVPGKVINGPDLSFESQAESLRYLDTFGHGTHLAGIIAGRDDAGSQFSGMAPDARLLSLKVADAQGAVDVSQVIAAIDWVVQHRFDEGMNVRVINLAYGTDGVQPYQVDPLSDAVERAWHAGIVVVVAVGNDGNSSALRNPAIDPYVIAVGAAENSSSSISGVTPFSNCGTSERFVDLVAPGRSILSLRSPGSYIDSQHPEAAVDGTYFLGSGTSQAAAVVTGAVALVLDKHPDLTPDQVKAMLMDNAEHVQGASFTCQGEGALDLQAVMKARTPTAKSADQTFSVSDGSGSLEASRGSNHVSHEGVALVGEIDIMGNPWTGYCGFDGSTTCLDSLWDGGSFNGSVWTGLSWSGLSWSGLSWSGLSWSGLSWSGLSWSGLSWSGLSWSGLSWSGLSWSGLSWSGLSWSGDSWSGLSWK